MSAIDRFDVTCINKFQYEAAINGEFEAFRDYQHQPLDSLLDINNNTILHIHLNSSAPRSKNFVLDVLDKCPNLLQQANNDGNIPLHIAASYGNLEMVALLIEQSKKPIYRDFETRSQEKAEQWMLREANKMGDTALHLAVKGCDFVDVVREILKHEDPIFVYTSNEFGETPLFLAADKQREHTAVEILNKFESPECGGPKGSTAFHVAVSHSFYHYSLLDLMMSKIGSFVSQADESGWTPLHYAAYLGKLDLVEKMLEKGKSSAYATDKERNRTPLHLAACRGFRDVTKAIIEECPDCCSITDVKRWNVLHYAVFSNSEATVEMILKNPSLLYLINAPDIKGYTPLHLIMNSHKNYRSFLALIGSGESTLLTRILQNEKWSIYRSSRSPLKRSFYGDHLGYSKERKLFDWIEDLGRDPFGDAIREWKGLSEKKNEAKEKLIPKLEKAKDSHLVAAALVATVTFAAAFTLPGGYKSDEKDSKLNGTPILSRNAAFQAFVITDAIALVLSTSSVFIHFIMAMLGYKQRYYWLIQSAFWFIVLAMAAMVVSFVTGTYAVLAPNSKGLAIAICVIGLAFFLHVLYAFLRLVFDFIKSDRVQNRGSNATESLQRLLYSTPRYLCSRGIRRAIPRL